jgi:hypothetical protein
MTLCTKRPYTHLIVATNGDKIICHCQMQIPIRARSDWWQNVMFGRHFKKFKQPEFCLVNYLDFYMRFLYAVSCSEQKPFCFISVHLFAFIRTSPIGRISVKFYIGRLYGNVSRKSMFFKTRTEIWDTLHKESSSFIFSDDCYRQKDSLFKGLSISFVTLGEVE